MHPNSSALPWSVSKPMPKRAVPTRRKSGRSRSSPRFRTRRRRRCALPAPHDQRQAIPAGDARSGRAWKECTRSCKQVLKARRGRFTHLRALCAVCGQGRDLSLITRTTVALRHLCHSASQARHHGKVAEALRFSSEAASGAAGESGFHHHALRARCSQRAVAHARAALVGKNCSTCGLPLPGRVYIPRFAGC